MAISVDSTSENVTTTTTTNSYNHTIGSGSDRILFFELLIVQTGSAPPAVTALTVDGNTPTFVAFRPVTNGISQGSVSLYYYIAPPIGSVAISVTVSSTTSQIVIRACSYFGAKQTSPINTSTSAGDAGTGTFTISITPSVSGCWGAAAIDNHTASITSTTGCVFRTGSPNGDGYFDSNGTLTSGVQHDFVVGLSSGTVNWGGAMCAFEPSTTAVSGNYYGNVGYYQ